MIKGVNYWVIPGMEIDLPEAMLKIVIRKVKFWTINYTPGNSNYDALSFGRAKFVPNYGVKEVLGKSRYRPYVVCRQIYMWLLIKYTKMNLSDIGRMLEKDHATVIHARKVVDGLLDVDSTFEKLIKDIEDELSKYGVGVEA